MGGFKDEKSHRSNKGFDSMKSQGRTNSSMLVGSNSGNKILVTKVSEQTGKAPSTNSKNIKQADFMNSILLKNELMPNQQVEEVNL